MEKKEGAWVVGLGWVTVQRRGGVRGPPSRAPPTPPLAAEKRAGGQTLAIRVWVGLQTPSLLL